MVDTLDKLVQNVADGGTNILGKNATVWKTQTSGFAEGSVAAGDILDSAGVLDAVTLLRRRNAPTRAGDNYVALIHPDVSVDIMSNAGWLSPHQYVDVQNIYNAEIGTYLGARFVMTPRATKVVDGAGGTVPVYRTYFLGSQALVEAQVHDGHIVIGPQVDKLKRFFPIGWYAHLGEAIFRQESLQNVRTASSISGL
jgi:N4-gp56 family major capsid protein